MASAVDTEEVAAEHASVETLQLVHDPGYISSVERLCASGGGELDPDTVVGPSSWQAALAAAGAGITATRMLQNGFDGSALVAVRPPGHHALTARAMGFCLFNNVAVTAMALRDAGERVAIIDWDVHHGNGTQETFYRDDRVFYASLHQYPFYPFAGSLAETGEEAGKGYTVNVPLPAFTAGDVGRIAFKTIVLPKLETFEPDWILVSAGFDGHALDPLAELRFTEGDYAAMTSRLLRLLPRNRYVVFLEGGYHLPAIRESVRAVASVLCDLEWDDGEPSFESPDESWRALERARLNHGTGR